MARTRSGSGRLSRLGRALLHVGLLEWVVAFHLVGFVLLLAFAADRAAALPFLGRVLFVLAVMVASTVVYRRFFEGRPVPRFAHQALVVAAVFAPFFWLKQMIPIINPHDVDAELRAIDLWLVGGDVSIWLERFASPFTCAWFGVSYYGYYLVGGAFVVWMMLFCRRQELLIEFGVLLLGAACVADLTYTVLPALGPYHHLADRFLGPLPEDVVVPFVHGAIQHGPLRDVFPSMHTCLPLCIFLFSVRHMRPVALATGLWLPHIVLSTVFLRYHYLIDVAAGAALALVMFLVAGPAVRAYQRLRRRRGVMAGP